jgi:cobalamin biosynthesis Mg chelatase CobN
MQDSLDIVDASDSAVQAVIDRLLPIYKEYQLEKRDTLASSVKECLLSLLKESSTPKPVTLSLNQSMQNLYNRSGSKRSRPEELEAAAEAEANAATKPEVNDTQAEVKEGSVEGKASSKSSGAGKKKKATISCADSGDGSLVNPLQVPSFVTEQSIQTQYLALTLLTILSFPNIVCS